MVTPPALLAWSIANCMPLRVGIPSEASPPANGRSTAILITSLWMTGFGVTTATCVGGSGVYGSDSVGMIVSTIPGVTVMVSLDGVSVAVSDIIPWSSVGAGCGGPGVPVSNACLNARLEAISAQIPPDCPDDRPTSLVALR